MALFSGGHPYDLEFSNRHARFRNKLLQDGTNTHVKVTLQAAGRVIYICAFHVLNRLRDVLNVESIMEWRPSFTVYDLNSIIPEI
jgi:hypothetical protein